MAQDSPPPTGTLYWLQTILRSPDLSPTETLLLVALADHVGANDRAWPSISTLARLARCSYATAQRRLTDLEEKGVIHRTQRRRADGGRSTYEYHLRREFFGDPPLNLLGAIAHQVREPPYHLGARAEVPNEPHIEPTATPLSDCERGCVEGYVCEVNDEGYSVLTPCHCRLEQSA